jgi:hypothetical protein
MNGKYKSIGFVLWRVMKNPLCADLSKEEIAEYALEYIRLLGAPLTYLDKTEIIKIVDYKGELPCDLIHIKGIQHCGSGIALRWASDNFHLSNEGNTREFTYTTQKGILFTSFCEGDVEISYKAIALDEEGYPLIPDDEKVTLGLEYFILYRYLEPLWLMGKITDKAFNHISQQRDWYIGAADASLRNMNPDQLETVMNGINRIIRSNTAHLNSFRNLGEKEYIRRYS